MPQTEQQFREDIVRIGRYMSEKGWIAACEGNISVRLPDGRILATPSGVCKGRLAEHDMILCDADGHKIEGAREPTSEMGMHLAVYRTRADVHAVVHAHPPVATGFAVAGRELNLGLLPEVIVGLGSVPLAQYGTPGTPAMSEGMLPYLERYDALLLANHGAVTWGEDVFQAFFRMDTVEHLARITLVAELLGRPRLLPRAEIEKLYAARARYGVTSPNRFEPGCPLAAEDMPDACESTSNREERSSFPRELTRERLLALIDEALKVRGAY